MCHHSGVGVRHAAKVILLDPAGRVLLFRGFDTERPDHFIWFTPGGGAEPGETIEDAARRELSEETGLEIDDFGPVVHEVREQFRVNGQDFDQHERYFVVRLDHDVVLDSSGWTDVERACITEHRWWTRAELEATAEIIYPVGLLALLD